MRGQWTGTPSPLMTTWIAWSVGSLAILGPIWLESRLWLCSPRNLLSQQSDDFNVSKEVDGELTGKFVSRLFGMMPLNEITQLSITRKTLRIERNMGSDWRPLKVGHLSDLHFTGQLKPEFYDFAIDRLMQLKPDLIAVTGDIIDKDSCLEWIEPILGRLSARLGCVFLFGNHERRLTRIESAAELLCGIGWHDLGARDLALDCPISGRMILCGNERPWFERHIDGNHWERGPLAETGSERSLRIALAHTPDQIPWARELDMDLLLAGHTHGGQVRIPGLGPIIAPSRYGSRFASGVFRLPPTVMHVSRGLAGVQPLRWRCRPEISLLTIVSADNETESIGGGQGRTGAVVERS